MKQNNLFNIINQRQSIKQPTSDELMGNKAFDVQYVYEKKQYNTRIYASNVATTCEDVKTYINKVYRHSSVLTVIENKGV